MKLQAVRIDGEWWNTFGALFSTVARWYPTVGRTWRASILDVYPNIRFCTIYSLERVVGAL